MKKIKSIYVREIGEIKSTDRIYIIHSFNYVENFSPITYNSKTNTYHQENTEYKGEHIISVTYEE